MISSYTENWGRKRGGAADDVSSCFSQSSLEITFILLVVVLQSGHWRLYDYLLYKNERVRVYVRVYVSERERQREIEGLVWSPYNH